MYNAIALNLITTNFYYFNRIKGIKKVDEIVNLQPVIWYNCKTLKKKLYKEIKNKDYTLDWISKKKKEVITVLWMFTNYIILCISSLIRTIHVNVCTTL